MRSKQILLCSERLENLLQLSARVYSHFVKGQFSGMLGVGRHKCYMQIRKRAADGLDLRRALGKIRTQKHLKLRRSKLQMPIGIFPSLNGIPAFLKLSQPTGIVPNSR